MALLYRLAFHLLTLVLANELRPRPNRNNR